MNPATLSPPHMSQGIIRGHCCRCKERGQHLHSYSLHKLSSACLQVVESLYGQDLDSGHHGSGFPLPPSRKRLLEEHLKRTAAAAAAEGKPPANGRSEDSASEGSEIHEELRYNPEEAAYSEHCWNINNLPRCKVGILCSAMHSNHLPTSSRHVINA